jgi:hypothetical protein
MRLSRQFDRLHGTLCQHYSIGVKGSSGAYRNGEYKATLNPRLVKPSLDRLGQVGLNEAPRELSRLDLGRQSSPLGHALLAGRTRTKTSRAKSYSPGIAWFPECREPAATWPAVHRSSPDDPVRHAISPWLHASSRETTSGFLSTQQTSSRTKAITSPYAGFTSHLWDFIANNIRFRTSTFLYPRSSSSSRAKSCEVRSRRRKSAGASLGGNYGSKS